MRSTCEIVADLKDGKEVPYEELKMACLVQSFVIWQYQQDVKHLAKGGIAAELTMKSWYSDPQKSSAANGISSAYWNAMQSDPEKFLSPQYIPGTPEWEKFHKISTNILNHVLKEREKKKNESLK